MEPVDRVGQEVNLGVVVGDQPHPVEVRAGDPFEEIGHGAKDLAAIDPRGTVPKLVGPSIIGELYKEVGREADVATDGLAR